MKGPWPDNVKELAKIRGPLVVCFEASTSDLDRPKHGLFRMSQPPMIDLRETMRTHAEP